MKLFLILVIITGFNARIQEAEKLAKIGRLKESIAIYEEILRQIKGYQKIKLTFNYVDVLIRNEEFGKALKEIAWLEDNVSKYSMLYPGIIYRKAFIYEKIGNLGEARELYEKIVKNYTKSKFFEDANKGLDRVYEILNKDYIATVGPLGITYSEFEKFIKRMPPFSKPSPTDTEAIKRVLDNLISWKLLYLEALDKKIDLTQEFQMRMEKNREKALANLYMEELDKRIKITEEEIKDYFAKHKEDLKILDKWDLRRIEVKTKLDAINILRELKKGKKFEELAQKYSLAPDARIGGLMRNFTEKSTPTEFVGVLKNMKENEIRGPIKLSNGNFAIIKLLKKYPGRYRTFEEARNQIIQMLKSGKRKKIWEELRKEMLKKYPVKYYFTGKKFEVLKEEPKMKIEK